MPQSVKLSIKGLFTDPSQLTSVPDGALAEADNIVVDRPGVADCRRGQTSYGQTIADVEKMFVYEDTIIANSGTSLKKDSNGAGTWTNFTGTFSPPSDANRIRSAESNKNLYLTTSAGIKKLDAIGNEFRFAGVPPALGPADVGQEFDLNYDPQGFLPPDGEVAYRLVWGYTDANDNEIVGAPSARIVVHNPAGEPNLNAYVTGNVFIPSGITTQYFYGLYRTSTADGVDPGDEMQLVIKDYPTSAQITAGIISFTDNISDDSRGATLYTSPSQEGILEANYPPPLSRDVALFKGHMFYSDTSNYQQKTANITLVNLGGLGAYEVSANTTNANNTISDLSDPATLVSAAPDLTFTAATPGYAGNLINVTFLSGGTAGAEDVDVYGNSVTVKIQAGVSTPAQVKTAWDAVPAALALATVVTSGATTAIPTTAQFFSGGFDTTALAPGMKVSGTGIPADTYINSIVNSDSVTISKNATTTATNTLTFQDFVKVGTRYYWAVLASPGANEFLTATSYLTPTTYNSQNELISDAAKSLVYAVNSDASQTAANAFYLGDETSNFGSLLFRAKDSSVAEFAVYTSKPSSFTPALSNYSYATAISVANPTVITSTAHGLTTGDEIVITNSNSTPTIDGTRAVTVINANTFTVAVNVTVAGTYAEFAPVDEQSLSTDDHQKNMLIFSKFQQPEAAPLLNRIPVGSANYKIIRIKVLGKYLFIFKEVEGCFILSGSGIDSWSVDEFDPSLLLTVPESLAILNNNIYGFFEDGILAIQGDSDNMSLPIKSTLLKTATYAAFGDASWGMSYESDYKYIFYTLSESTDTTPTIAYVWNYNTQTWTTWDLSRSCGIIKPSQNKMYQAALSPAYVYAERKSLDRSDYADQEYPLTVVSSSDTTVTVASTTGVLAGMTLVQGDLESIITEVTDSTHLEVTDDLEWVAGAAFAYAPIPHSVQWVPETSQNVGILKQVAEVTLLFRRALFDLITVGFQTNISYGFEDVEVANEAPGDWGILEFGEFPWGEGEVPIDGAIRTYVPAEKQRAHWINFKVSLEQAFCSMGLEGISDQAGNMSSRFK